MEKAQSLRVCRIVLSPRVCALFVRDDGALPETQGVARPPLSLKMVSICLFVQGCVDSKVARIGNTRFAGAWTLRRWFIHLRLRRGWRGC